jgi:hypothetical protein
MSYHVALDELLDRAVVEYHMLSDKEYTEFYFVYIIRSE